MVKTTCKAILVGTLLLGGCSPNFWHDYDQNLVCVEKRCYEDAESLAIGEEIGLDWAESQFEQLNYGRESYLARQKASQRYRLEYALEGSGIE